MSWKLGQYIEDILYKKGGRRSGWTQARLAELSGLSAGHISWIVTGETSGKKGRPTINVDTLIALSKALGVSESSLLAAYKGEDPEKYSLKKEQEQQLLYDAVLNFIKNIPPQTITEALEDEYDKISAVYESCKQAVSDFEDEILLGLTSDKAISEIPKDIIYESVTEEEMFRALLEIKGPEKMRELIQEAIRRYKEERKE